MSPKSRVILIVLIGLTVIAGAALTFVSDAFWFPDAASTVAADVDLVFNIITWISIFFFVLIVVVMVYFVVKYHTGGHGKATSEVTHNTPLELTWTIIPLILVIAIFYVGMQGYLDLRRVPAGAYEVKVTAQKWFWTFQHRNGAVQSGQGAILRVPVGQPVKLVMTSQDVLHALFIPAFRVKQDIVPGRYTYLWFEATREGEFDLFCAEYCGKDHSQMVAKVIAYSPAQFEAVQEEDANWIDKWELPLYQAGPKLYNRCASCHSLKEGETLTGPSWRETYALLGKERVFTDGSRAIVDERYIQESILTPQKHVVMNFPASMPSFQGQLKPKEIDALIEFLKHLNEFDDTGKLKPEFQKPADQTGGVSGEGAAP